MCPEVQVGGQAGALVRRAGKQSIRSHGVGSGVIFSLVSEAHRVQPVTKGPGSTPPSQGH